ncbi:glycoside hydrolase family 2 protein [Undibacterium sp. TS12]|uniref:glycoside hydrolase family 2 protein n=1 Tax=Undibacterium sp. TS12 TaxID=2908202 RepID=UPI001F4C873D|nr:glycoside hydrolase family 2 protein [Undibacterium sp. TS12]MCH8621237.1 glycoside hydrolase family 2 protein [Undibacterium sp. TS12]
MTGSLSIPLEADWQACQVASGKYALPSELQDVLFMPAPVPGTIASALHAAGQFVLGQDDFDEVDVWYCCDIDLTDCAARLHFEGLATHAEIFWNDRLLERSDNMFCALSLDLHQHKVCGKGRLSLRFIALNSILAQRRARPRWKTRLVAQQQLRWLRTSLLGRMPGWSPPLAPVGPYRAVMLELHSPLRIISKRVLSKLDADNGVLELELSVWTEQIVSAASIRIGELAYSLQCQAVDGSHYVLSAQCYIQQVNKWWPHTHGEPGLYDLVLEIQCAGQTLIRSLGKTGFRQINVDQHDGGFHLHVNQVSVFCRGACWTPLDVMSLQNEETELRKTLMLARDAGMNMLRVIGTMVYESTKFYQACDELGILVWQDCMFANMDYPVADPAFAASIRQEVQQFLNRIQNSPCIAVVCGNSEVEQQAAMLGQPAELWSNIFFSQTLPELCLQYRPDVQYWPSSPSGGVMPFQTDQGVAHYFGVGAYLRPLEDARRSNVRFTTECLGFANMPDDELIDSMLNNGETPGPHPAWKQGVPRDNGTAWDFEDVRDHYMAKLYDVDVGRLRFAERECYLALARTTTGEVMARTLAEWRRVGSACHGALIWFWKDLRPGAGWGVIDAHGRPKAAYYYLKRAMAALTVLITDEGLNGLALHVLNDGEHAFTGELELALYRQAEICVARGRMAVQVPAHGGIKIPDYQLLPHFVDTAYAYRFGPPGHDVAVAQLYHAGSDAAIATDCLFPDGQDLSMQTDLGLQAYCAPEPDGAVILHVSTKKFAQAVSVQIPGLLPEDNYFHLAPGSSRQIRLSAITGKNVRQGQLQAQNAVAGVRVEIKN